MSTRSSSTDLFPPSSDPESIIRNRQRNLGPNPQNPVPDLRLMEELLQAPTDGVGDAIVVPPSSQNDAITALTKQVEALSKHIIAMQRPVHSIQESYETYGGPRHYSEGQATGDFTQRDVYAATRNYNARGSRKKPDTLMHEVHITSPTSTAHVPPLRIQLVSPPKPKEYPKPNPHQPKIPYPSWLDKIKLLDKNDVQVFKFLKILKQLYFDISIMDALTQIPKYSKVLKGLLKDKEKLEELANTMINAECSAILLNKVPEKLRDPGKFLIPCVLQDLKKLGIRPLKPTRMTLELANRSVTYLIGIAEDVIVKLDKFNFLADFVIVDFEADPRVPIILGRPFLRTAKAFVDLYKEKLTLRIGNEELRSGSTTSHSDPSLFEYESFYFDLSIDTLPPADRSDSYHEEFLDELDHIISPPKYDHFYFVIEADLGKMTRLLKENISSKINEDNELKPKTSTKELTIHEPNEFRLLLSNCDSTYSEEFSEIDPLISFPSKNKDKVFDPGILIINRVHSKRSLILPSDALSDSDIFFLEDSSEINPSLSFPSENEDKIPSDKSKVHIEVLSVLWGNRLPILDGSFPLSRWWRSEWQVQGSYMVGGSPMRGCHVAPIIGFWVLGSSFQKGLQDFKSVSEYNSTMFSITSKLTLCGEKITKENMLKKTFSTFHASNMLLQQQYRERSFKKYHKLISVFLVAKQNNELMMKSHQARPTGSTTLPEVNATSNVRGRGSKHATKNSGNACHRCGMKTHWAKQCRTSRHFVDLYQASLEKKGKDIKINFIDIDELIPNVRLDTSDFFDDVEDVVVFFFNDGNDN
ncbi:reverse transcriptase domain-containing protein [Tanacetum coccineum]